MRRIDRDDIKDLIIDVSLNGGGMTENVYYTLNYFTDKPIDINAKYRVIDEGREKLQMNIERSPHIKESDRERLVEYIGTLKDGTVFARIRSAICNTFQIIRNTVLEETYMS